MKRLTTTFCAAIVAIGSFYIFWLDPWKDSILFRELLRKVELSSSYQFDLIPGTSGIKLDAHMEVDALKKDGFSNRSPGVVREPSVMCGSQKFSLVDPVDFTRVGDIILMDKYTYGIEIRVDDKCLIYEAIGSTGPV